MRSSRITYQSDRKRTGPRANVARAAAPAGSALGGSRRYFAKGFGPRLGLVPGLACHDEIANSLKSQRTRWDSNLRPMPPEGMGRNRESKVSPRFSERSESGGVPLEAVRRTESPSNPAPCRVDFDAEELVFALWCVIKVV
jgi:hypothetical protein